MNTVPDPRSTRIKRRMHMAAALAASSAGLFALSTIAIAEQKPKIPPELKAMVTSAVDNTIVPAYQFFADVSGRTTNAIGAWCETPTAETLASAREAFAGSVHAWARIQHIRFGPARTDNRWQRIAFLPDPRGVVRRQVAKAIADRPAELVSVEAISGQSAALQGLPALEILLHANADDEAEDARAYSCRLAQAVAGHVTVLADAMVRDWTDPRTGWRQRLLTAGEPDNADYKSANEATAELVRSLLTGLQLVREEMLLPWMKVAEAKKPWAGLPFERAGLSRDVVSTSILALRNLHKALHLDLVVLDVAANDKSKAWMKGWIDSAYDGLERDAREMVLPSQTTEAAAASEENLMALRRSRFNLNGLRQIIGRHIAPASALTIGFNELDGD